MSETKTKTSSDLFDRYAGVWGGRTESGEEMWWSTPNAALVDEDPRRRRKARRRFYRDTRQYFILEFLHESIAGMSSPKIVDFGCGSGGTTLNFSNYLGVPIDGYDIFATQLEIARLQSEKIGSKSRFALLGPRGELPVADGSLDVVVSFDVLGHVPDPEATLRDWARALRPGGSVVLFTESSYSAADQSLMARLAREGTSYDMTLVVPEHISLRPREEIEEMMRKNGLRVVKRYSANVGHFFFFPKDYVQLLRGKPKGKAWFVLAWIWNRLAKLVPFYPQPLEWLRLQLTRAFGQNAYGTSYFYLLEKTG